jgi:hypothetical protein
MIDDGLECGGDWAERQRRKGKPRLAFFRLNSQAWRRRAKVVAFFITEMIFHASKPDRRWQARTR